jgi:hypothetical protein
MRSLATVRQEKESTGRALASFAVQVFSIDNRQSSIVNAFARPKRFRVRF